LLPKPELCKDHSIYTLILGLFFQVKNASIKVQTSSCGYIIMSQLHGDQLAAEELQASVNASSVVYAAYNQLDLESQGIRLSWTGRGNGDMRENGFIS